MNPFARPLTIVRLIACLSLSACREDPQKEGVSDLNATQPELITSAESETHQQEIADLQRNIQTHEQNIENLNALITMERTKVEDNPDYDSPILNEVLSEQEQELLESEKARSRLEVLIR
jgi:hypothetical protein